ncbi:hypothetical protein [Streptomyces sp. TRM49041]|uniref:hypothetical protein n=1 Tax=Streptomyces sp. TRM49041 TaxID=2603216 RepID=UPI0011EFAB8A|nr:hypothetical protein [Streptomyces sp. TRM49041]
MRIRMRRGAAVALTVSALVFTAACGGSAEDKSAGAKQKTGESGSAEQKPEEKPAAGPLTAAQMKAGILEVSDLPSGWKVKRVPDSNDVAKADKAKCQPLATLLSDKVEGATEGADVEFSKGVGSGESAMLAQQIFTYDDTASATDFLKSIATAVDACPTFTFTQDGDKVEMKAEKLTVAQVGEESVGLRLTLDIPELNAKVESDLLIARQATGVMRLAYVPMAEKPDHAPFDDLAKRGGDKFVKGAQS